MSAYSQIFTKATDFVGSVAGGVDPRTGQFVININFGTLSANNGLGPDIPLMLSYSPMARADLGFGIGFGFGFTSYEQRSTLLSLASGSNYKVLENSSNLSLIDAKLKEVSVQKFEDEYYKVIYKDGSFELLSKPSTMNSLKVPLKIVSANGHYVSFDWKFINNQFRLISITDENGVVIARVSYPDTKNLATRIAILPDRQNATQGKENPEGYNFCLLFNDSRYLSKVICDVADGLEWKIGYTNLSQLGPWGQVANSITHPGGFCEYVDYSKSKGHRFAGMRTDMKSSLHPYVTDFTHVPGGDQPTYSVHYDYGLRNSHNFLGYSAAAIHARNPTVDALYNCSDPQYSYYTRETHTDNVGVQTRIDRQFNCFHQLVGQTNSKNNCCVAKNTVYYSKPGGGFESQAANFECPKQTTVCLYRRDINTGQLAQTTATTSFTYDNNANILTTSASYTDGNGSTTQLGTVVYEYYAADLETDYDAATGYGCPADPNSYNRNHQIRRFLKSKTVTPRSIARDEKPSQTRYSYTQYSMPDSVTQLLSQSDPDRNTSFAVFISEERSYDNPDNNEQLLNTLNYKYADKTATLSGGNGSMHEFGLMFNTVNTHYPNDGVPTNSADPKTAQSFSTTSTTSRALNGDTLETTSTVTTWDNLATSSSQKCSRFSGFVTETTNALGVKRQATYDMLGRILTATTAAGREYADTRQFEYDISNSGIVSTVTDSLGNKARVTANGAGKPIQGEVKLNVASSLWQVMGTRKYDNAGRLESSTLKDYSESTNPEPLYTITSAYHYDVWGRMDCVTSPDGVKNYSINDPIFGCKTTYSESPGPNPIQSSKIVTTINIANATLTAELFEPDSTSPNPYSKKIQTYDGWKQLRTSTDELMRSLTFNYDIFGRAITTTLPACTKPASISIEVPKSNEYIEMPAYDPANPSAGCPLTVSGTATPEAQLRLLVDGIDTNVPVQVPITGNWSQDVSISVAQTGDDPHTICAEDATDTNDKVTVTFYASRKQPVTPSANINILYPQNNENVEMPAYDPTNPSQDCPLTVTGTATPGITFTLYADGKPDAGYEVAVPSTGNWSQNVTISVPQTESSSHTILAADVNERKTVNFSAQRKQAVAIPEVISIGYPLDGGTVQMPMYSPANLSQACPLTVSGTAKPSSALELYADDAPNGVPVQVSDTGNWSQIISINVPPTGSTSHTIRAENVSDSKDQKTVDFTAYRKHSVGLLKDEIRDSYSNVDITRGPIFADSGTTGLSSQNDMIKRIYDRSSASSAAVDIKVNDVSMGTREFDGMGRVTSLTVGGRSWSATYDTAHGSLTAPATVTSPFITPVIDFEYEPALGGAILKKTANDDHVEFTYSDKAQLVTATSTLASCPLNPAVITNGYDEVGRLLSETFSQQQNPSGYSYTTAGRAKSYTDVMGKTWEVGAYDAYGRPTQAADADVSLSLNYDALGRVYKSTTTDKLTNATLTTTISWDTLGREQTRQVDSSSNQSSWRLEQAYNLNHQLSSKVMKRNVSGTFAAVRTEAYTYDERNRLIGYTCAGSDLIKDEKGKEITSQTFTYDVYSNITQSVTTFQGGDPDTATYSYTNMNDPCQLSSVTHSNSDYPTENYQYDAAGNLVADASGRQFTYDTGINLGYLRSVEKDGKKTDFFYDAANRIISEGGTVFVYRGSSLVNQSQGLDTVRFVGGGAAQVRTGENAGVWLSGSEANGSVLSVDNANADTKHYDIAYSPYGEIPSDQKTPSTIGYTGQRKSNLLDGYHLGNGYRLYQPSLRRFTSPDSMSPFGLGGINPYAYCAGDPINSTDPTGHFGEDEMAEELATIELMLDEMATEAAMEADAPSMNQAQVVAYRQKTPVSAPQYKSPDPTPTSKPTPSSVKDKIKYYESLSTPDNKNSPVYASLSPSKNTGPSTSLSSAINKSHDIRIGKNKSYFNFDFEDMNEHSLRLDEEANKIKNTTKPVYKTEFSSYRPRTNYSTWVKISDLSKSRSVAKARVDYYFDRMNEDKLIDPIDVTEHYDGNHKLRKIRIFNGNHRYEASRLYGFTFIPANIYQTYYDIEPNVIDEPIVIDVSNRPAYVPPHLRPKKL
ncbi:RHS repeat-associated core domain-containing protein [Ochrobactrum sp. MYb379]|uniref:RHS repeat-associated core domain-containing protein n=1 Tax=Ochrobactrum sp. MYb379 TaxID=2745275 RepID=UPI0030B048BE